MILVRTPEPPQRTVKLRGNFLPVNAQQAVAEALTLAKKNGVDPKEVADMLTQTLFTSPFYQGLAKTLASDPEQHPVNSHLPLKDVSLFKDLAAQVGSPAPLAPLLQERLREAEETDSKKRKG